MDEQYDRDFGEPLNPKKRHWRMLGRVAVMFVYCIFFAMAYWLAFLARYDFIISHSALKTCYHSIGWVVAMKFCVFFFYRHFHGYGIYATFKDFQVLVKSSFISSVSIFMAAHYWWELKIPRTVPVLDCIFTIFLIGTVRFAWRFFKQEVLPRFRHDNIRRTLVIGANRQGVMLASELETHPEIGCRVVGFISLHGWKLGQQLGQIPVIGHVRDFERVLSQYRIQEILTLPGILNGDPLRSIMEICRKNNVRLRIVPNMESRLGGASIPMREINIEDLLKRDPIRLDNTAISELLGGKRILVTGAGGSIGSEICRQIIAFEPKSLVILGRGENRIFYLEKELIKLGFQGELISVIADVTNEGRIESIFKQYAPNVVFHAAAHKHVSLMENNISEAIHNNVKGTKVLADAAHRHAVTTFVLISTDKAVNPTSVMGATKHMAERYVHSLASRSTTQFVATRFGNVLGSTGSVVPIFRRQIAEGGPITITDFRMTRFFMTIPEASQLVLQAAAIGSGGEIFVLDMGKPIPILELAKDLIRLSGLPENAIEIRETGIRPGEKLYEELYFESEKAIRTAHEKLRCASHRRFEWERVDEQVRELIRMDGEDPTLIQMKLHEFIEEYNPEVTITIPMPTLQKADDRDLRRTG